MSAKIIAQLIYNPDNDTLNFDGDVLSCGDEIEVLVINGNMPEWIDTTVEYFDNIWCLTGLFGYEINGLFARR